MRLSLATANLSRREWAGNTAGTRCKYGFELLVRSCVEETGENLTAHVALYYENVSDEVHKLARPLLPDGYKDRRSFFVDVLNDGKHVLSVLDDPDSWWQRWSAARLELYDVAGVGGDDIARSFESVANIIRARRRYSSCMNIHAVCCCPCACASKTGVTCVSTVLIGLAVARGGTEKTAERTLRLKQRVMLGARLPSVLLRELVEVEVVAAVPRVSTLTKPGALPLLAMVRA